MVSRFTKQRKHFSLWKAFTAFCFYTNKCGSWRSLSHHHLALPGLWPRIRELSLVTGQKEKDAAQAINGSQKKICCASFRREDWKVSISSIHPPKIWSLLSIIPLLISTCPPVPKGESWLELINWEPELESEKISKQDS